MHFKTRLEINFIISIVILKYYLYGQTLSMWTRQDSMRWRELIEALCPIEDEGVTLGCISSVKLGCTALHHAARLRCYVLCCTSKPGWVCVARRNAAKLGRVAWCHAAELECVTRCHSGKLGCKVCRHATNLVCVATCHAARLGYVSVAILGALLSVLQHSLLHFSQGQQLPWSYTFWERARERVLKRQTNGKGLVQTTGLGCDRKCNTICVHTIFTCSPIL